MLRASASSMAMVCSVAAMVLPVGELMTSTPRRVAASTSMLSTPTPARPITCSLTPASISSLVTRVSLRTTSASYSAIALLSSSPANPRRTSTSAKRRSSARPSSAIGSVTKTRKRELIGADGYAGGDLVSQLHQHFTQAGQAFGQVLFVHVTHVADANDLVQQVLLPDGDHDVVLVFERVLYLFAGEALRHVGGADGGRGVLGIGEQLQPQLL